MIIDLQRQVRQVGRIRIGDTAPTSGGKSRPVKLSSFRLSSPDRQPIEAAAALWGGEVAEFDNPLSNDRWQVTTEADSLPVIIPPSNHFDQWMELWTRGGCDRRCDGREMVVADGRKASGLACMCDPDERVCKATTRLWVILPDLEALGTWRLESHGWYAATELGGAVELCSRATAVGISVPARLGLEQRSRRSEGKTVNYAVPVLSVDVSIPQAAAILRGVDPATGEVGPAVVKASEPPAPTALAVAAEPPQRTRPEPVEVVVPRTGAKAKTAAERGQGTGPAESAPASPRPMTDAQRFAAGLGVSDDDRHALYRLASGDPLKERFEGLTPKDRAVVARWANEVKKGRAYIDRQPSGLALIAKESEEMIASVEIPATEVVA